MKSEPEVSHILSDSNNVKRLSQMLLHRAHCARTSVVDFFEFVLTEEHSQRPIKVAPHQRVGLDFIIKHDRSVNAWPVNHSKTFCVAGLALRQLGLDCTSRGAIISATQEQAMKPLRMVRQHIETNPRLKLVFPKLRPSTRDGDPWTQHAITVERPYGIRDPSLMAVGLNGAVAGSRLNWIIIDDILTFENTRTKEQRDMVDEWLQSTVISRLDPKGAWICVMNTAWHPDDIVHRLKQRGWPMLRMEIGGDIEVHTPPHELLDGSLVEDTWGITDDIADELRPSTNSPNCETVRLTAHDPDSDNQTPLWPERFPPEVIAQIKSNFLPHRFNQLYRNVTRDDATARCKQEYIDLCKERARQFGHYSLVSNYLSDGMVFTGVDLAISPGEEHDDTAFFTFAVLANGYRLILDIDVGQWPGPEIVRKIFDKHRQYNSVIRVENNAAQDFIRQFALEADISLPIKAHTTGRAKAHPEHGVEGLFVEMSNGAWLIPNDTTGRVNSQVGAFLDACKDYRPTAHTPDVLMACYFAREQARAFGAGVNMSGSRNAASGAYSAFEGASFGASIGASLMSR
jgi:hypothetical protein